MSSSRKPTVSAVVPVRDGGDALGACLMALSRATPPPHEILVVVDGAPGPSADADAYLARELGARVALVGRDAGPARARNLGARHARGDVLLFVDADVAVRPDAVARVVDALAEYPEVAAVFGSYDDTPAAANFVSQFKNLFHHWVHQTAREEASTFWAGCGAVRSAVFLAVGGFDETYRTPSIEDIELGYRLTARGHAVRLSKALQATHLKRWTPWSLFATDVLRRAVPWTQLILRDRRLVDDLNVRVADRVGAALTWLVVGSLGLAWVWPRLGGVAGISAAGLLALNAPLYRFFLRKRGPVFLLRAIAWHWLYYLYGTFGFFLGALRHLWSLGRSYRFAEHAS
jgi:GT2 family glycosyltransferase